ncbi:helix-turn-helix domain-containing protein [Flavobacterium hercynium]|uniref:AraC family transcriptional regulator n=1 Tax=Flavobacterium hercynium TaxID=387094 RepID=A0A226GX23_9FLAO|nr:AraC family transcriptional regulator [Flavobacterium hercynium]OXA86599.1 AraC family transcriptional regulator [Flavobacterium hercynium]SMP25368.1 Helix-turn-helix domain-containing protein [Flavobacterium hercynium]
MKNKPVVFETISQLHNAMGQAKPMHPLISILNYGEAVFDPKEFENGLILNFYKISFKTQFTGKIKYGHGYYDFEEGGMSFVAPGQILRMQDEEADYSGMSLHIHPDFIRPYSLNTNIKKYGFFSYSAAEALYLSEKEKETILGVFKNISEELNERIDNFSQDVIISQIEVLLNYSNRFYNRQFITRKANNHDVLSKLEILLEDYFKDEKIIENGVPTVQLLADALQLSPRYLSDLLRNTSGQNTQQFIHDKLIEKAKEYIANGNFSVSEIAYKLGFEHPQSFSKLFKKKTSITPLAFKELITKN